MAKQNRLMTDKSPWHNLEFIFMTLTIVSVLVVFSFYFDAGVFGKFSIGEELTSDSSPLVQPRTQSEISYVYANGQRIASLSNDGVKYYHSDYLGSSRVTTDSSGVVASSDNYPFGSVLNEDGQTDKYTFTGKELDSTGLQYFGARYYDSRTGRFTQVDPLGPGYAYAANNPMKFVDPTGMENERVFMENPVYVVPISVPVPASKYRSLSENEIARIVDETPQMWKNVVEAYAHEYLVHVPSHLVDPYKDDNGPLYWDVRAVESLERIQPVIEELTGVTVSLISGFRTFAEQSELKKVNPQAEDPGKSYHNLPIKISEGTPQEVMTKIFSGEGIIGADFRYKNGGSLTDVFWALETFGGFEGITEPLPIGTKNPEFRHKNLPLNNLKPGMSLDFVESRQNPLDDMPVP